VAEPWIERVIREAQEAGKLDVAEGAGKPIPGLSRPYDPSWWARNWIVAERARERAAELASTVERELPRTLSGNVIEEIRSGLESLNARIFEHNDAHPGSALPLLDVDRLVLEWEERRR
jgi:hypothetical protein